MGTKIDVTAARQGHSPFGLHFQRFPFPNQDLSSSRFAQLQNLSSSLKPPHRTNFPVGQELRGDREVKRKADLFRKGNTD